MRKWNQTIRTWFYGNNQSSLVKRVVALLLVANVMFFTMPAAIGTTVFAGESVSDTDVVFDMRVSETDVVPNVDISNTDVVFDDNVSDADAVSDNGVSDTDAASAPAPVFDESVSNTDPVPCVSGADASDNIDAANGSENTDALPVSVNLGQPKITFTTNEPVGSHISFLITAMDVVYVDTGDGNIIGYGLDISQWEINFTVTGPDIKFYCTGDITSFHIIDASAITLDVSNCPELISLMCGGNQLTELNVSNNPELTQLECDVNQLTEIDVSNCPKLRYFHCRKNMLTSLDISNNTELVSIFCDFNQLTELDVSNNPELAELECDSNQLTELDLTGNPRLHILVCNNNQLTKLDLIKNTELYNLDCSNNLLTELYFNPLQFNPIYFCCVNNFLKFSQLKKLLEIPEDMIYGSFYYNDQGPVQIAEKAAVGEKIDLSSEYDINGTITNFQWWYDGGPIGPMIATPATAEGGVFTFDETYAGMKLYCKMENGSFSGISWIFTTEILIEAPDDREMDVVDENGHIDIVEPDDDASFEGEDGSEVVLGDVRLIIGNVAENNKKTVREAIEAYNSEFKASDNNHAMYDIHLENEKGVKVEMVNGRIRLCLKYPDNLGAACADYTYNLYHIKDDGTVEEITIEAKPNGIWFYADDFSPYVLTYSLTVDDTTQPTTVPTTPTATTTPTVTTTPAAPTTSTAAGSVNMDNVPKTGDSLMSDGVMMAAFVGLIISATVLIYLFFMLNKEKFAEQ